MAHSVIYLQPNFQKPFMAIWTHFREIVRDQVHKFHISTIKPVSSWKYKSNAFEIIIGCIKPYSFQIYTWCMLLLSLFSLNLPLYEHENVPHKVDSDSLVLYGIGHAHSVCDKYHET